MIFNPPLYEWLIKDKAGNTLVTLDSAKNRQFKFYMNKPHDAQFDISIDDPKLTADMLNLGDKELYIYRSGVLIWGGELLNDDETVDENNETRTVYAKSFANLLSKKTVGSSASPIIYTLTDPATFIPALIVSTQTGTNQDFGITVGVAQMSVDRTITFAFETLLDICTKLCSDTVDDGFEFDVDPMKVFNLYYPQRGTQRDDIVFEYKKNFIKYNRKGDSSDMINQVAVYGAGSGSSQAQVTVSDTGVQDQYKVRQGTLAANSISDTTLLTSIGQQYLNLIEIPVNTIQLEMHGNIEPFLGTYDIGDNVRLIMNRGITQIDGFYRVYEIDVALSDSDDEDITVTLSNALRKTFLDHIIDLKKRVKVLETTA